MNNLERIRNTWHRAFSEAANTPIMRSLVEGNVSIEQYASILAEIYHQVRRHPAALASMTLRLRGRQIDLVPSILRHALSETGHDLLALKDLETLGYDKDSIVRSEMLPETQAILGHMYSLLTVDSPLAFLGYLFHLEFMPTASGKSYIEGLKKAGVPDTAVTFINDHSEIDVGHNKLMKRYLDELVESESDLVAIEQAACMTVRLYVNLLTAAVSRPLQRSVSNSLGQRKAVSPCDLAM